MLLFRSAVQDMQEDTDQVMVACLEPEELAVEHVRKPRQRMPVTAVAVDERPAYRVGGQAVDDERSRAAGKARQDLEAHAVVHRHGDRAGL